MKFDELKTVVVIGAGAMGRQIAMNTVLNGRARGYRVLLCDSFAPALESAETWADGYLAGRVEKGRITKEEAGQVRQNLTITSDVDGSAAQADFVIEAIVEDLKVKRELFARISKICRPDAVLSTNSSNIVSSKLADVTEHPERLMNVHYFNPALAMKLLNSAMLLRDGENWGYATVDLMCMNLFTGEADFYKYGAAPTYVKSGGALKKLRCTSFAPGLEQESGKAPDELHMHLKPGSVAVIASDGVVSDGQDLWLRRLLNDFEDGDMKTLAGSVVRAAIREYGREDDMTALAVKVEVRS